MSGGGNGDGSEVAPGYMSLRRSLLVGCSVMTDMRLARCDRYLGGVGDSERLLLPKMSLFRKEISRFSVDESP